MYIVLMAAAIAFATPIGPASASPLPPLSCAPFEWVKAGSYERAAMTTHVKIRGQTFNFQIDTGANETLLYAAAADRLGLRKTDKAMVDGSTMEVGGAKIAGTALFVNRDVKGDDGLDGALGLQSLIGRVTVIDYPGKRFCILDEAKVPDTLWTAPKWTSATVRNGKLFVPIRVGDVTLSDIAFDTGSSLFPLVVDGTPWRAFTGKTGQEDVLQKISGSSWGKPVTYVGDSAKEPMALGKIDLGKPVVFTKREDQAEFATWPFHIDGLIGNAPLWDRAVVLDLTVHMRFGVVG